MARFADRIANGNTWPRRQDAEFFLSSLTQMIRDNFSSRFAPLEVHLEHPAPEDPQPLERMFRALVRYLKPINRLIIARPDAHRVSAMRSKGCLRHASAKCATSSAKRPRPSTRHPQPAQ
ncbi:AraC family transcriptional regulator ligand-binding domain-containing protein [Sagittula sp. P11]|uniref:AraC family transcriptional regulator ligand-binding domain-containing protein n=1 Tax=Sagittula sp. P11 TaxID=2009329 RepID=UPI003857A65C